ncbi:hypothetical protein D3C79_644000 [compost metagenome]
MTGKAEIVPGSIASPSIKEIALLLRSMGIDITKDKDLMNHLRIVADMPTLTDEIYEEAYANAGETPSDMNKPAPDNNQDEIENDFEQNDLSHD